MNETDGWWRLDRKSLPAWVDSSLLDGLSGYLRSLSESLPRLQKIDVCMANSTAMRMTYLPLSNSSFACPVPIGLVMRLDFLVRVLESEKGVIAGHIIDDDYYAGLLDDIPEDFEKARVRRLPEPFASFGSSTLLGDQFWKRFTELNAEYPQPQGSVREIQNAYVWFAVAFCVLHEASHLLRRHKLIIEKAPNPEDATRGAEVDADFSAGVILATHAVNQVFSTLKEPRLKDLNEAFERITYAVCVVLGLFDLEQAAFSRFLHDCYGHPTARLNLVAKAMCMHLEHRFAKDRDIGIAAAIASADGASDYVSRMNSVWSKSGPGTKRPTSIYVAKSFGWLPPEKQEKMPFGSLFNLFDIPTPYRVYREAMDRLERFNDLRDQILKQNPSAQNV